MSTDRFSCSMLDCIRETSSAADRIITNRKSNCRDLLTLAADREIPFTDIVLIGSGSSFTAPVTAKAFVEKVSGLHTEVICPSDFVYNTTVYKPDALYVFLSQTGTSKGTSQALDLALEKGLSSLAVSESRETPLAQKCGNTLILDCGIEEYPMRTVGFSATVMTCMVLGLELGLYYDRLSAGQYRAYIEEMQQISGRQEPIIRKTLEWLQSAKRNILRSDLIVFTGADSLHGIAQEGAVKVWETLQTASVGYELEEGMHGPNYGYNSRHCVIVLDNGGREHEKAVSLARYMKDVWKNGFLIGPQKIDAQDLEIEIGSADMCCIDFATVVQTIAYKTAEDQGRDLFQRHDNSLMESYFKTHA